MKTTLSVKDVATYWLNASLELRKKMTISHQK